MILQRQISVGSGRFLMEVSVALSSGGISVYLCGGERPHIGTTVLAEPRKSLTGEGWSCTSSVMNLCGHKDDVLARNMAETFCALFQLPVCVCAGVHIDDATEKELAHLSEVFQQLKEKTAEEIRQML